MTQTPKIKARARHLHMRLSDSEERRFKAVARRCGLTLSSWVRQILTEAEFRDRVTRREIERKA